MAHPNLKKKKKKSLPEEEVNIAMEYANKNISHYFKVKEKKISSFPIIKSADNVSKTIPSIKCWNSHASVLCSNTRSVVKQPFLTIVSSSSVKYIFSSYGLRVRNYLGRDSRKCVFLF